MSSVTSTDITPSATHANAATSAPPAIAGSEGSAFRPWHFFVVLTLLSATAAVLMARKVGPEHLIMLSVTIFAAGGAGYAIFRTLLPLTGRDRRLTAESLSHRTRAALEREKLGVLRSIKELEFDRAMGKVAPEDFDDMARRLRSRALGLMQQLDADTAAPRARLEQELAERLQRDGARDVASAPSSSASSSSASSSSSKARAKVIASGAMCTSCGVTNDLDARFCKACGTRLEVPQHASRTSAEIDADGDDETETNA